MTLAVISSCGGGDGSASPPPASAPTPTAPAISVRVQDVTGKPISGAAISLVVDATTLQATSGADGTATFESVPSGEATVTFNAAGFESTQIAMARRRERVSISLRAVGEWSLARLVVLGSRMLDRSTDGSTLTFSVDLAVMDGNSGSISNLSASDFRVETIDCGWGGPRDCATDASGRASGAGGNFSQDGSALAFALQPMAARRPYVVSVLAERSKDIGDWSFRIPALKSFFSVVGGNDAANLASLERVNGASALSVLGPYTRDGRTYLPLIDQLSLQAGDPPAIAGSIAESIRLVAAARNSVTNGAQPMVLVLSHQELTVEEFTTLSAQARQAGVQVSVIDSGTGWYGLTELAVRTGGFIAQFYDPRQLQIISGSLDSLLAGTQPFYRITYRIKGTTGTFVAGGNAKVWLQVGVPASFPNNGATAQFDVAIP